MIVPFIRTSSSSSIVVRWSIAANSVGYRILSARFVTFSRAHSLGGVLKTGVPGRAARTEAT